MTIDEIKEILRIFNESGVGELELHKGKDRLKVRSTAACVAAPAPVAVAAAPVVAAVPVAAAPAAAPVANGKPAELDANQHLVKSPIVGTFYESASPGAAPFVKVGDAVEAGQVLCIIESMKLMNEIESEVSGTITAKLVENGKAVEYGEALFSIKPR